MVRHNGTAIAFAVNAERRILYSALDLSDQPNRGPLDSSYWQDNPTELAFPDEVVTVGEGLFNPRRMPVYKVGSSEPEAQGVRVRESEKDRFRSTTASLSAAVPIQVLSDGRYVYVFRQSLANDSVGVSAGTLLVDRFLLSGTSLQPKREVRFQRSRNKYVPQSRKDGLGAKDMEQQPFFEPTQELRFIHNLQEGRFAVLVLPTEIAAYQRWQIFAHNAVTGAIDSFSIERASDGLFNLKGTQPYTCPDHPHVYRLRSGNCPEPAVTDESVNCPHELIPIFSVEGYAEWALRFDGVDDSITLQHPLPGDDAGYQAIEFWLKPEGLGTQQTLMSVPGQDAGGITLHADGTLRYSYHPAGDESAPVETFSSGAALEASEWAHIALIRDAEAGALTWYINGEPANSASDIVEAAAPAVELALGGGPLGQLSGYLDEVRVWARPRGQCEIVDDMRHRLIGLEPGLLLYWRFDEGSGTLVHDQSDNAQHGIVHGDAEWVESDAPVGDHPGVRRTSFRFDGRQVVSGMSALLYYHQKTRKSGYDAQEKPLKTHARVMLAVATHPESGGEPGVNHIAVLDFGLSRDGKLAQVPDSIHLQPIEAGDRTRTSRTIQSEIERYEQLIHRLGGDLDIPTDQPFLDAALRRFGEDEQAEKAVFVQDNVTIGWSETDTEYEAGPPSMPKTLAMANWVYGSGAVAEFLITEEGAGVSGFEDEYAEERRDLEKLADELQSNLDIPADRPFLDAADWVYAAQRQDAGVVFVKDNATLTWRESGLQYEASPPPTPQTLALASWTYDTDTVARFVNTVDGPQVSAVEEAPGIEPERTIGTSEWLKAWTDWGDPASQSEAAFAFGRKYYYFKGDRYRVFDADTRQFVDPVAIDGGVFPGLWNDGVDAALVQRDQGILCFFRGPQYKSYQWTEGDGFSLHAQGTLHDIYPGVPFLLLHPEYNGDLPDLAEIEQQLADHPTKTIGSPEWLAAWTDWEGAGGEREGAFALGRRLYYLKGQQYRVFDADTREFYEPVEIAGGAFPGLWPEGIDAALDRTDQIVVFFRGPLYKSYRLAEDGFTLLEEGNIHELYPGVPFLFLYPEYNGELPDLDGLNAALEDLRRELAEAQRRELADLEVEIEMHPVHTDPFGLTTTGALLSFAWTVSAPLLFDSANGKLALYFRGRNDQFYVVYYDTMTKSATFGVPAEADTRVILIPRVIGPVKETCIEIAGEDAQLCTVTLEDPAMELREQWEHVPRSVDGFASVLNGTGARALLGHLAEPLSGEVRGVKISDATPNAVKPGRLLVLGADRAQIQCALPLTALAFDGVDDYVELPEPLIGEAGTIEMWVRFSELFEQGTIFDASTPKSDSGKFFYLDVRGGHLRFGLEDVNDTDFETAARIAHRTGGIDWHHVAAVWQYRSQFVLRLYFDGELVASKDGPAQKCPTFLNPFLGKSRSGYHTTGMFAGQIAQVCIRDVPLTPEAINASYELGLFGNDPELTAGCWRFQDVAGSPRALDRSPNQRHGTLYGGPALQAIDGGGVLVKLTPLELSQDLPAREPVYTDYDYDTNAVFSHRGREARSLLFAVDASQATGTVQNGTITGVDLPSPMTRWIAYSQGSALEFDGIGNDVRLTDAARLSAFDADGDLTLEAWVRPEPLVEREFSTIVHHYSGDSLYLLGLQRRPLRSAMHFNAGRTAKAEAWAAAQPWHWYLGMGGTWAVAAKDAALGAYRAGQSGTEVANAAEKAAREAIHYPWFFPRSYVEYERQRVGQLAREWALSWYDASPDYVECRNTPQIGLDGQAWTVELWFRPDTVSGESMLYYKEQVYKAAIINGYFHFAWSPHWQWTRVDKYPVTKHRWYHVAITYDGQAQRVYIDGELVLERAQTGPMDGNDSALLIGACPGPMSTFEGTIDEVRFWNVARTNDQVSHYSNRRLRGVVEGLAAYWHFEEGLARDHSGHQYHGIVRGTPVVADSALLGYGVAAGIGSRIEGEFSATHIQTRDTIPFFDWNHLGLVYDASYALLFTDDGAHLDCGDNASLNLIDDLTIEVFFRLDDLGQPRGILAKGGVNPAFSLYVNALGRIVFAFSDETGREYAFTADANSALQAGRCYRVAVTRRHQSETRDVKQWRSIEGKVVEVTIPEVEEWDDIEIHVCEWNGTDYTRHIGYSQKYSGPKPGSNSERLVIGRASSRSAAPFKGVISEVRVWNRALGRFETCQQITGAEGGLISWWRLDENDGYAAEDATGTNHASIVLADWVRNPDPQGSPLRVLCNGVYIETEPVGAPDSVTTVQGFSLGSLPGGDGCEAFKGTLEELRIWRTARTQEQIQDNLFLRLLGGKEDLIAYYTFDRGEGKQLRDYSFRGNHLTTEGAAFVVSDAPISYDTYQIRNALLGVRTDFHVKIHSQPGVQEYGDMQFDAEGNLIGILKRCYSYIQNGQWYLTTGYKVGNLITEWIGQVQFNPELKGYIEGAPPVPSENLTAGPEDPAESGYAGIASIEVVEAENITYNYATSKEAGLNASFGLSAKFGVDTTVLVITAPLGIGTAQEVSDVNVLVGFEGKFDASAGWSSENAVGVGRNLTQSTTVTLGGHWEDPDAPVNRAMRRRYQPANVGFALVQSETADVFALRLEHNLALVSYQFRPNPDIPKDWNLIAFPINPRYTKQGTLDGAIGYDETGKVLDPDYPHAREYGEYSYYKPKEAYALKNRITREEQELANYFRSVDTDLGGAPDLAISAGLGLISGAAEGSPVGAIEGLVSALGSSGLPEKLGKQNVVNTYVWTAEGGFFAETTETMAMRQETSGGNFSFSGEVGGAIETDFSVGGVDVSLGFNAMLGGTVNMTKTKTKDSENSFQIDVELDVPGDLQAYDEDLNPVYGQDNSPVIVPGKVNAYRFMTFYLESSTENFDTFFNTIVDPIWLQENDPNALALREARQTSKKPPCWRVMHRVTFVSRVLPEIPAPSAPPLERNMKAAGVEDNWQLIQKLEPFVLGKTATFEEFSDAIREAVRTYYPELTENSEEIIEYLSAYYQVYED
jgi:hypothetical protein